MSADNKKICPVCRHGEHFPNECLGHDCDCPCLGKGLRLRQEDYEEVDHPQHYQHPAGIECIDVVEHWPCNVANAVKYLWRAGLKPGADTVTDLRKAAWYVDREIARLSKGTPS